MQRKRPTAQMAATLQVLEDEVANLPHPRAGCSCGHDQAARPCDYKPAPSGLGVLRYRRVRCSAPRVSAAMAALSMVTYAADQRALTLFRAMGAARSTSMF